MDISCNIYFMVCMDFLPITCTSQKENQIDHLMKYALVNNTKTEATKGVKGFFPICGSELVAKLGEIKIHHWAHKGNRKCDHQWENETEWHRLWKSNFPVDWQEVVHIDENNEKHIADVKTIDGWSIEFQHSPIKPEERYSRNNFYKKIVWVVDGLRREKDKSKFHKVLEEGATIFSDNFNFHFTEFPEESRIIREWINSKVPVFFDFNESSLWFLFPLNTSKVAYFVQVIRNLFIESLINHEFDSLINIIYTELNFYLEQMRIERQKSIIRQNEINKIAFQESIKRKIAWSGRNRRRF